MTREHFTNSAGVKAPPIPMMKTPDYVRLGQRTHIGAHNKIEFERPCVETKCARAEPALYGLYVVMSYWRLDFIDALDEAPEVSSVCGDSDKFFTPGQAQAELVRLMKSWKHDGYVIDNISPAGKPALPQPSAKP